MTRALALVPSKRVAVGYIRVSDEGGRGDDLLSPRIQERDITAYCKREDITLAGFVTDINKTGRSWAKRKIEGCIARVEDASDAVNTIVVWKWSRVARNTLDYAKAAARVETMGGEILSANEPFDPSAAGVFGRDVLVALAAMESRTIGDGWKSAHRLRFDQGLPPTGRVQWCMKTTRRGVEIDETRAAVVRELYRRYNAGEVVYSLAAWLRASGHSTNSGKQWQPSVVQAMLDSEMHAGYLVFHGETKRGVWPAVIDENTWTQYQAQRRDRRRAGRRQASPFLLSGLAVCDSCGHPLCGSSPRDRAARLRCQYQYVTGDTAHEAGQHSASVTASVIDAEVYQWLERVASGLDERVSAQRPVVQRIASAAVLTAAIGELDRKLVRVGKLLVEDAIDPSTAATMRAEYNAERAEKMATLEASTDREIMTAAGPLKAVASDLLAEWPRLTVVNRRAALRTMISEVRVSTRPEVSVKIIEMETA